VGAGERVSVRDWPAVGREEGRDDVDGLVAAMAGLDWKARRRMASAWAKRR
jgi:hypothetical protein